jgi:hypothetical protein
MMEAKETWGGLSMSWRAFSLQKRPKEGKELKYGGKRDLGRVEHELARILAGEILESQCPCIFTIEVPYKCEFPEPVQGPSSKYYSL